MLYQELRQMIIEHMEHEIPMSLKSLVNSVLMCEDISHIQFSQHAAFRYQSLVEIMRNSRRSYMSGFIYDKHGIAIFNNSYFYVYDHNDNEKDCIWFSDHDLISLTRYRDRKGQHINEDELQIDWINTQIHVVSVEGNTIDSRVIFY